MKSSPNRKAFVLVQSMIVRHALPAVLVVAALAAGAIGRF